MQYGDLGRRKTVFSSIKQFRPAPIQRVTGFFSGKFFFKKKHLLVLFIIEI